MVMCKHCGHARDEHVEYDDGDDYVDTICHGDSNTCSCDSFEADGYPGQSYWWRLNANIRRAEERWESRSR